MYGILPPPHVYLLVVLFWDDFQKQNQNESWTNPLTNFQSYLGFLEGFLTLLVIKIKFFLEFSCFCTFCAENDPGTTQKKWQQRFSCLEMYFGGNNHGCQEYSKNLYKYTQADRLNASLVFAVVFSCRLPLVVTCEVHLCPGPFHFSHMADCV